MWDTVRLHPTPERQSTFWRTYDPTTVVYSYRDRARHASSGGGSSMAVHSDEIARHRDVNIEIALEHGRESEMMTGVREDLVRELGRTGAQIRSVTTLDDGAVRLRYQAGRARGEVTVKPPASISSSAFAGEQLVASQRATRVTILLSEVWVEPLQDRLRQFVSF